MDLFKLSSKEGISSIVSDHLYRYNILIYYAINILRIYLYTKVETQDTFLYLFVNQLDFECFTFVYKSMLD